MYVCLCVGMYVGWLHGAACNGNTECVVALLGHTATNTNLTLACILELVAAWPKSATIHSVFPLHAAPCSVVVVVVYYTDWCGVVSGSECWLRYQ